VESEQSKKQDDSFTQTYNRIYYSIPCRCARAVFHYLTTCTNISSGDCYPSIPNIVKNTLYKRNNVEKATKLLCEMELINKELHLGKNNIYTIKPEIIVNNHVIKSPTTTLLNHLLPGDLITSNYIKKNYIKKTTTTTSNPGLIETTPRPIRATNNIKKQDKEKTTTTKAQPKSAPHAPLEKFKSSSSSFFESNKEKEIPVYLLETIGFTISHVTQIANKGILTVEEITESIKAYANVLNFDSKKAKAIKDPLAYFMGILKNGNTYLLPESTKKVITKKATSPTKPLTEEERRKYENEAFRRTKAELLGGLII